MNRLPGSVVMRRSVLGLVIGIGLVIGAGTPAALAQDRNSQEQACSRDVSRHCRKVMNDGDQAIYQCLLQNRDRLSSACRRVVEQR